jgi:hypothetical protein
MTMPTLTVYDPALCCSTGVCGPKVDEALVRFAADVEWLKAKGLEVRRFNLAQEPGAFAGTQIVQEALMKNGVRCLPLLMLDGREIARGRYPDRAELSRLTSLAGKPASPALNTLLIGTVGQGCTPDSGCC